MPWPLWRGTSDPFSKAYAKAITSCLAIAYHENMDLKKDAITHEIPFLQGKVVLDKAKVHVKCNNKNLPSLLTTSTGNQNTSPRSNTAFLC